MSPSSQSRTVTGADLPDAPRPTTRMSSFTYKPVSTSASLSLHAARLHIILGLASPGLTKSARLELSWHSHLLLSGSRSQLFCDFSKEILRVEHLVSRSIPSPKQANVMYYNEGRESLNAETGTCKKDHRRFPRVGSRAS